MSEQIMPQGKKAVGSKETLKAIENGLADKVFIAKNAEKRVTLPLIEACQQNQVPIIEVETMDELGKACEITVKAAAAALLVHNA
jgi:large subunit ribosomal protein L7A